MVVGFVLMLLGVVLFGLARSTKGEEVLRFGDKARKGLFGGGAVFMVLGLLACVLRMVQWTDAMGAL